MRASHLIALIALTSTFSACASAPICPVAPPASTCEGPEAAAAELPDDGIRRIDTGTVLFEDTPDVPDELRARLQQYVNTRSAALTSLSDDGQQVLVVTRFGETRQVHRVRAPLGARTQLTFNAEPVAGASFITGDPDAVLYQADIGGDEQHQLWRLDLGTGRSTRLTDPASRNQSALFSRDGRRLAYASTARNGRDFDIWISDGRDPESATLILETSGYWFPAAWSRDGAKLIVGHYVSVARSSFHVLDLATGALSRLTPEDPPASYRGAVFGVDNRTVYLASDREGEHVELYETDLAGSTWRPLSRHIPWSVESLTLSPDGRLLAFSVNEGGYSVVHLLDTRSRRATPIAGIPPGIVTGLRFARGADVLGFTLNSATSAGDTYTYDVRQGRLLRWTESEIGGLDPARFVAPERIAYEAHDGLRIPALYYRPPGPGPFPVLVNIHGGPEVQARPTFHPTTQYLVSERGVAVIFPNVRGSAGYGKTYLSLDDGMRREDAVTDIGSLLDWIAAQPELDAERVGVVGGSYGGYMVLASLVHFPERIVAGLSVVGISSFITFLENTADYRRDLRRAEYGDERDPEMRAFLERISPLSRVDRIRSALFVAQGANDPRVPEGEGRQIVDAVRASGHEAWYMLARNEGHGFARKENSDALSQLLVLFFERHLTPDGPATP